MTDSSSDISSIKCPGCSNLVALQGLQRPASFPFCTDRCRLLDLGAWVDGEHVIEGKPVFDEIDDQEVMW